MADKKQSEYQKYKSKYTGRPSVLSEELKSNVFNLIMASVTVDGTCKACGIARSTWYLWKKKAEEAKKNKNNKNKKKAEQAEEDQQYIDFFEMVEAAEGMGEVKLVLDLQKEASPEVKLKLLRARYKDWREVKRIEASDLDIDKKINAERKISKEEIQAFKEAFEDEF